MRNPKVLTASFLVEVCLYLRVMEVEGIKYTIDDLKKVVMQKCCTSGKREIQGEIPKTKASVAKNFLTRPSRVIGGLHVECCHHNCSNEEVYEGAFFTHHELGEECVVEGCSTEEIREHC